MADHEDTTKKPLLSTELYNDTKIASTVVLPALAVLYAAIAGIWHLPYIVEVGGTVAAIDTFLGALLLIGASSFKNAGADGTINTATGQVELNDSSVLNKDTVVLTSGSKTSDTASQ